MTEKKERILFIDDEKPICDYIEDALSYYGYEVITHHVTKDKPVIPEELVKKYACNIDGVLTDYSFGKEETKINGFHVINAFRKECNDRIGYMMLSGHVVYNNNKSPTNVDGYPIPSYLTVVAKPVLSEELVTNIKKTLKNRLN
ncbi:MAG: response regulator [Candidatus Woesearchaeota archaeon]|jgi:CheY-like chemotaxis protein